MGKVKRDTPVDLFNATLKLARESGHFKEIDEILDYADPYDRSVLCNRPITSHAFDTEFSVDYGNCEGICILVSITGFPFGRDEKEQRFHIGILKTCTRGLENMMLMGKACGILQYFSHVYIDDNMDRFTPEPKENK